MQVKRRLVALALALTMVFAACSTSKVVAKVNGEDITQEEFDKEFEMNKKLYVMQYGEEFLQMPGPTGRMMETEIKDQVLNLMIMYRLMNADLKANNIELTADDEKAAIESAKSQVGDEAKFKEFLETTKLTEDEFNQFTIQNTKYQKHMEMYAEKYGITDDVAKAEYEKDKNKYDILTASHILVETEDEAKAVVERLNAGESFEEVAKEVSKDEGSKVEGGSLGQFTYQTMVQEFSDAAFALEIDKISDPVQSQFGWHVIKVTDRQGDAATFAEQIKKSMIDEGHTDYLNELETKGKVERLVTFEDPATEAPKETEAPASEAQPQTETPTSETPDTTESDATE